MMDPFEAWRRRWTVLCRQMRGCASLLSVTACCLVIGCDATDWSNQGSPGPSGAADDTVSPQLGAPLGTAAMGAAPIAQSGVGGTVVGSSATPTSSSNAPGELPAAVPSAMPTSAAAVPVATGQGGMQAASDVSAGSDDGNPAGVNGNPVGVSGAEAGAAAQPSGEQDGKRAPDPSAGCGNASPQTGDANRPLDVANHRYYVKLPSSYDAERPYPTLFVFHPTNNPLNWAERSAGFENNGAKENAIRVYPGAGNNAAGWNGSDVSFFGPLYDEITNNFCVDRERVFAAGESSGGDFSSILGCEYADKLRAVGPCATKPVNGYPLDAGKRMCTGKVAAVVIHGKSDRVVGPENGPATRDFYTQVNNCEEQSMPVEGFTDSLSNCVEYQGCDEGFPVFWCQHEDPEYGGTNHGWPRFAANMLWQLFSTY